MSYARAALEQLRDLEDTLEFEGYKKGSAKFDAEMRARRVKICQEFQGVMSCTDCPAFLGCGLAEQHLRDRRYGVEEERDEPSEKSSSG
jgi:hypothetical protein